MNDTTAIETAMVLTDQLLELSDQVARLRSDQAQIIHLAENLADALRSYLGGDHRATSDAFTALSRWEHRTVAVWPVRQADDE